MRRVYAALVVALALLLALPAMASAGPQANAPCVSCHASGGGATSVADFRIGSVDLSKCSSCHWYGVHDELEQAHPGATYEDYLSKQCNSCHHSSNTFPLRPQIMDWPAFASPSGWFQSAASLLQSPETLHAIHANGSWLKGQSGCDSCHGAAACTACHEAPAESHAGHGSLGVREMPTTYTIGKKYGDACPETYLYQSQPAGNFDSASVVYAGKTGSGEERFLIRFPLAKIAGRTITTATVQLTRSSGPAFPLRAYRTKRDWSASQASWNAYKTGSAWSAPGGSAGIDYDTSAYAESSSGTFDVTPLVRAALAEGASTLDLIVLDPAPVAKRYNGFYSSNGSYAAWYPFLKAEGTQPVDLYAYGPVAGTEVGDADTPDYVTSTRSCVAAACHDLTKAGTTSFAPACTSCHPDRAAAHGYDAAIHTGSPAAASITISGVSYGAFQCASCHSTELGVEHTKTTSSSNSSGCAECHPNPRSSLTPSWDRATCVQGGCHVQGSASGMHGTIDADHARLRNAADDACFASGCHAESDLASLHSKATTTVAGVVRTSCAICHAAGVPTVKDCTGCHDATDPHGDVSAEHTAAPAFQSVVVFDAETGTCHDCHGRTLTVVCSACHKVDDIATLHGRDCALCHGPSGPISTFTSWNKGCQQGACHPSIHARASGAHTEIANAGGCSCHPNGDSNYVAEARLCSTCHTLDDTTPPVTSADAKPANFGRTLIHLSAADAMPGSGVTFTYYRLDGGPRTAGTSIDVAGPAAGTEAHSLEYWSVDGAGNVETHKTVAFSVTHDSVAPTTTSDAVSSYVGTATIRLTATDDNPLGVKATYYKLDGAAVTTGTVIRVQQPASGTQAHTLEFWSVDLSDNEETHHSVSFTIKADTTAPVTTSDTKPYYGLAAGRTVTISLTATDGAGGSGVAQTNWRLSDGTSGTGTSVGIAASSHIGSNWIEFWSVDKAGNVEAFHHADFVIDIYAPSTTSNAVSWYGGPASITLTAADTGGSGVKATYYRLDGGAQAAGTSVVVSALGNHTLEFWSVDNAGNTETGKSVSFTVGAPDGTPPTTTSNAVASYIGTASIGLTAVDSGGSGVKATYYRLDTGSAIAGTQISVAPPASGSVSHTIYFWSVDNAGNTETTKSATFVVAAATSQNSGVLTWTTHGYWEGDWDEGPLPSPTTVTNSSGVVVYSGTTAGERLILVPGTYTVSVPSSDQISKTATVTNGGTADLGTFWVYW